MANLLYQHEMDYRSERRRREMFGGADIDDTPRKEQRKAKAVKNPDGINFHDIIPVIKPKRTSTSRKKAITQRYNEGKENLISLHENLKNFYGQSEAFNMLTKAEEYSGTFKEMDDLRKEFLSDFGYLPKDMAESTSFVYGWRDAPINLFKTKADRFTTMAGLPQTNGKALKEIADKFGFIGVPLTCLNEDCYNINDFRSEYWEIKGFQKTFSETHEIYVITPLEYYSLNNHVRNNTEERPLYVGQHQNVFTSISINIPMFRSILNIINEHTAEIGALNANVKQINGNIDQINTTLVSLQRQIDQQREAQIKAELQRQAEVEGQKVQRFDSMSFNWNDPILFAFKKGTDINSPEFDETPCYIGTCWGGDFDKNVALALDIKIYDNQRTKLEKQMNEAFGYNAPSHYSGWN